MYLIFDTETTGLPLWNQPFTNKYQPRVCQLACMLLDKDFKEVYELCCLIKPDGWTIGEGAYAAHGITQEVCEEYGLPISLVLRVFTALMEKANYVIAHNIKFDSFMMNIELALGNINHQYDWESQGVCTMMGSTEYCKIPHPSNRGKYKWPKLEELFFKITGEEHEKAHDAMADCRATAICFGFLVQNKIINLEEFKSSVGDKAPLSEFD